MESVQAPRCPACGFIVFNRLYPKCEGCGAALPEAMLVSEPERAAILDADRARETERAREREAAKAAAEQSALAVLAIVAAGH